MCYWHASPKASSMPAEQIRFCAVMLSGSGIVHSSRLVEPSFVALAVETWFTNACPIQYYPYASVAIYRASRRVFRHGAQRTTLPMSYYMKTYPHDVSHYIAARIGIKTNHSWKVVNWPRSRDDPAVFVLVPLVPQTQVPEELYGKVLVPD
jgi:hypothetical protein